MSKCIKTGARLFIEEFGHVVACDIYMDFINGADVIIIRYNSKSAGVYSEFDAKIRIGIRYVHEFGFIVCGLSDFDRDIREFCVF